MWLYYRCTELDRQFWRVRLNHLQICPTILHNFIEHSPSWGPKRFSATKEITCILHIPKVHYRMHKSPSLAPVLSLINSVHAPEYSFYYAHFNILPCTLRYSMWSLFMRFPHQNPVWNFLSVSFGRMSSDISLDVRSLRMRPPRCLETSGIIYTVTRCKIPEARRPQLHRCELKFPNEVKI